jgi:predicted RNase H-like HicB family nuclease
MRPFIRPFIAFIRRHPDAGFLVWFPDLPDCQTTGRTVEEARQNAENAVALHFRHLQDAGTALPSPSYMHELFWARNLLDGLVALIAPPRAA